MCINLCQRLTFFPVPTTGVKIENYYLCLIMVYVSMQSKNLSNFNIPI